MMCEKWVRAALGASVKKADVVESLYSYDTPSMAGCYNGGLVLSFFCRGLGWVFQCGPETASCHLSCYVPLSLVASWVGLAKLMGMNTVHGIPLLFYHDGR